MLPANGRFAPCPLWWGPGGFSSREWTCPLRHPHFFPKSCGKMLFELSIGPKTFDCLIRCLS